MLKLELLQTDKHSTKPLAVIKKLRNEKNI